MGAQKRKPHKRNPLTSIIRPLDPLDPRSLEHPCHKEQWLARAEAIGRAIARQEWNGQREQRESLASVSSAEVAFQRPKGTRNAA
jgi:hypothetical protein